MRLRYPGLDRDSGDLYGKVLAEEQHNGVGVTRIRLTSVDAIDQQIIDAPKKKFTERRIIKMGVDIDDGSLGGDFLDAYSNTTLRSLLR